MKDEQWERIAELLPGKASDCRVTAKVGLSLFEEIRVFYEA